VIDNLSKIANRGVFRAVGEEIRILRVLHDAMDLPSWLQTSDSNRRTRLRPVREMRSTER
jgi:hypothetical protein